MGIKRDRLAIERGNVQGLPESMLEAYGLLRAYQSVQEMNRIISNQENLNLIN